MKNKLIILLLLTLLALCSCGSDAKQKDADVESIESSQTSDDFMLRTVPPASSSSERYDAIPSPATQKAKVSPATTDGYEDGLTDGDAAAEEDRLAGKPGMQVGEDDDDEEDYDEGYEDGYEE